MSEYTPTMNEIRADFITLHTRNFDSYMVGRSLTSEQEHYGAQFDARLAAEKAKWQAEALREYADAVTKHADRDVLISWLDVVRDAKEYASMFFEKGSNDDR